MDTSRLRPQGTPDPRSAVRFWRLVAGYVLLFALLGGAWLRMGATTLPQDDAPADAWLIVWVLDWVSHALGSAPASLFSPPVNYPAPAQLAGSEHFLSSQLLFAPLKLVTGNAVLAANVTAFLCYPIAAAAMALLVEDVGLPRGVAFVAGFVYGFGATGKPGRLHVLQLQHLYLPLVALTLHRLRTRPGPWRALAFFCTFVGGLFSSYHMAVYLSVATAIWGLIEIARPVPESRAYIAWGAGSAGVALAALVAFSVPYLARPESSGDADILLSRYETVHLDEVAERDDTAPLPLPALLWEVGACALAAGNPLCVLTSSPLFGWALVRPVVLVYPFTAATVFASIVGLSALRNRAYRPVVVAALLVAAAGVLLAGPAHCLVGGVQVAMPPTWLRHTPARFIRVRDRAAVLPLFGGTMLMAFGLGALWPRSRGMQIAFMVLLVCSRALAPARVLTTSMGFIFELDHDPRSWSRFAPVEFLTTGTLGENRRTYDSIARRLASDRGPLLEWPHDLEDPAEVVGQMIHRQPSIDFYTGYEPIHVALVRRLIQLLPDPAALDDLVDMTGLRWILVRPVSADHAPKREAFLRDIERHPRFRSETPIDDFVLLEIDPTRQHPGWFEAIAAGPRTGTTVLGTPLAPLPAIPGQALIHIGSPRAVPAGAIVRLPVRIQNQGAAAWPAALPGREHRSLTVRIEASWRAEADVPTTTSEPAMFALRRDVLAGEVLTQIITPRAPKQPGRYELEVGVRQIDGTDLTSKWNPARLSVDVVSVPQAAPRAAGEASDPG